MSRIIKCLHKREWLYILATAFILTFQVWLDLEIPDYMSKITILIQTEGSQMSDILVNGGYMLLCSILSVALVFASGFFAARIAATVAKRLRAQVFDKTLSFSMSDMRDFTTGSLITRTTNDITQVQSMISMGYIASIRAPFMVVCALFKIFAKSQEFSTVTIIAVASLAVVLFSIIIIAVPKSKKIQWLTDKLNTVVREHLTGVRVVRAYNAEEYQEDKFETVNEEVASANIFVNRTTAMLSPYMTFLISSLSLAIYWVGAILINEADMLDKITIFSDMVVFVQYAMLIIMAFMMLTMTSMQLPRVFVALGRIGEVLDFENNIVDGEISTDEEKSNVSVEFKNVTFAYPGSDEAVIENISFKINKGETAAFIGSTGSGKSTIINLILRFYDCTSGEILVDGINVKNYTQEALRQKLGLVSQKAILFSGDITSNIAFGIEENVDESQIQNAVEVAQASDFIDKIGTHASVSQGGLNLSGGQKQRVSIARAIYKDPKIYLLDDCFSALDYATDKKLRAELLEKTKGATKLMVAQRISTVKDADQIIVLDAGKIAGLGKHKDLLKNSAVYLEIASSQLSKEELDYA